MGYSEQRSAELKKYLIPAGNDSMSLCFSQRILHFKTLRLSYEYVQFYFRVRFQD